MCPWRSGMYLGSGYFLIYFNPLTLTSIYMKSDFFTGCSICFGPHIWFSRAYHIGFLNILIKYAKKQSFQWIIWCKLLFYSCIFLKYTGEIVQYHFATLLYNLVSRITIVIQTYKKSLSDHKWDLNWILGHRVQFWVFKT